jgi:LEA14-like dessication related protein
MPRHLPLLTTLFALALAACISGQQPQLKVLSVESTSARPQDLVLFVEVSNPATRPLELQRLQYSFASKRQVVGSSPVVGEVQLSRTVEPGAAVVVEVPLPFDHTLPHDQELILDGRLYASQDQLARSFVVQARVAALP